MNQLIKVYRAGKSEVIALRGVSFDAGTGKFLVVRGPSGSGKSTLLSLIAGIEQPTAGTVYFEGVSLLDLKLKELEDHLLRKVGIVFQSSNLILSFTALENVVFPMLLAGMSPGDARIRARELLDLVGMSDRANHTPVELSGGERQRAAIAVALANDPPVLIADEPTSELDKKTGRFVTELLKGKSRDGRLVIVATHDERIVQLADRVLTLEDGNLVEYR